MSGHQNFKSLRLEGVGRAFGSVHALKDLSFEIQRGEFIALLGPSGCGKTTALNCVAGLLATTSGAIWLDDRRIDTLPVEDRGFGMVFQNYALFPHMTVRANIGFGLRMRGVAKAELVAKVDEALRVVRLEAHAHKLPGQLSGGQQQRVAIARAIAIDPPLVLMDEPLSNLDAKLRLEMRQEIRRLHLGLGGVTIYVTHDQDEALSMADRIVVMRDGVVRQIGAPHELYSRPAHADVAEFMGFRNRLAGRSVTAAAAGGEARVDVDGASLIGQAITGLAAGDNVLVAIRPEDLVPSAAGIAATVEAMEYRGRDWYGQARTTEGRDLYFRAETGLAPGAGVQLAADPARVLFYREAAQ